MCLFRPIKWQEEKSNGDVAGDARVDVNDDDDDDDDVNDDDDDVNE